MQLPRNRYKCRGGCPAASYLLTKVHIYRQEIAQKKRKPIQGTGKTCVRKPLCCFSDSGIRRWRGGRNSVSASTVHTAEYFVVQPLSSAGAITRLRVDPLAERSHWMRINAQIQGPKVDRESGTGTFGTIVMIRAIFDPQHQNGPLVNSGTSRKPRLFYCLVESRLCALSV
jgi:hypothetical protein